MEDYKLVLLVSKWAMWVNNLAKKASRSVMLENSLVTPDYKRVKKANMTAMWHGMMEMQAKMMVKLVNN